MSYRYSVSIVYEVDIFFFMGLVSQVPIYICCFPQVSIVSCCDNRYQYITVPFYFDCYVNDIFSNLVRILFGGQVICTNIEYNIISIGCI